MTVKQMIALLSSLNEDMEVMINVPDQGGDVPAGIMTVDNTDKPYVVVHGL